MAAALPAAGGGLVAAADGEVASLRSSSSRTYVVSGSKGVGYRTEVSATPLNYRDTAGAWQKIDTTLAGSSQGGWSSQGPSPVQLPPTLRGSAVSVAVPGGTVGFTVSGAAASQGVVNGPTVTYASPLPGVTISDQATATGVREIATLASAAATSSFTTVVSLPAGVTLSAENGGAVVTSASGAVLGHVPAPTVADGTGVAAPASAATMTVGADGHSLLTAVDPGWLTAAGRVFPVAVDPDFMGTASSDTRINGASPTTAYGSSAALTVAGSSAGAQRVLLSFGDVGTAIPRDAEVNQALLQLWVSAQSGGPTIAAYPLTTSFDAGTATWAKASSSTSWTSAGGDITSTEGDGPQAITTTDSTTGSGHRWFLNPKIVSGWLTGSRQAGFLLKSAAETAATSATIFNASSSAPPMLWVTWQYRPGIRPDQTYVSHAVDDRENLSVNVADGNVVDIATEFTAPSPGIGVDLARTYNSSQAFQPLQAGYGWFATPGESGSFAYGPQGSILGTGDGTTFIPQASKPTDAWYPWHQSSFTGTNGGTGGLVSPPGSEQTSSSNLTFTDNRAQLTDHITAASNYQTGSITDRNGNTETIGHSATSDEFPPITDTYATSVTASNGRVWTYAHQSGGYYTSLTPPFDSSDTWGTAQATAYSYSGGSTYTGKAGDGNLLSAVGGSGVTTTYTYDPTSREMTSLLTPGNREVIFGYQSDGRLTSMTYVTNLSTGAGNTTRFAYTLPATTGGSGTTVVTDPAGHTTTYTWNALDEVTKTLDGLGRARSATYNQDAQPATLTDNTSDTSTLAYDSNNNKLSSTSPNQAGGGAGRSSSSAYNVAAQSGGSSIPGYQYLPSSATDAQGKVTSYTYGATGDVATQTPPSGSGGTPLTYRHQGDPNGSGGTITCGGKPGQLCTSITGRGFPTTYAYNSSGDLTTITPPVPLNPITRTYDARGRLRCSTTNNVTTCDTYDGLDRVKQVQTVPTCTSSDISAGNCVQYSYDPDGNKIGRADQTGTATLAYDYAGYPTSTTIPDLSGTSSVGYDVAHNVTSYTDPGGTVGYGYDSANEVNTLTEPGGSCTASPKVRCTTFGYDGNGHRTTTTYPSGEAVTVAYDGSARPTGITANRPGGTAFFTRALTWTTGTSPSTKDTGLLQTETDNGTTITYGYDSLGRLTSAPVTGGNAYGYKYDADGGIVEQDGKPPAGFYANFDNADQICLFGNQVPNAPATTSCPGPQTGEWTSRYDGAGNMTAKLGSIGYSYNGFNQQTGTNQSNTPTTYRYADVGNQLLTKTATSGTTTSYTNGLLGVSGTQVGTGTPVWFTRDPSGTLISMRVGSSTSFTSSYYLTDQQGSVLRLTDATGNTDTASYSYDPYGNTLTSSGSQATVNPYRYASGITVDGTANLHLGARFYTPDTGRFTQPDPTGQNPGYVYAGNSPSVFEDPSGQFSIGGIIASIAVTATIVAVVTISAPETLAAGAVYVVAVDTGLAGGAYDIGCAVHNSC